jgi:uncharacterized membrane protein YfcA
VNLSFGAILIVAVFLTATLSGVYGMVGGMVLLWVLLLLLPVSAAIAVQGVLQFVANASRAWFARAHIDWRIISIALIGLGVALGVLSAVRYTPNLAVVSIAVGLLPITIWVPVRWVSLDASRPTQALVCGFLSGILNVGVGVAGPVVDIFFARTKMDRRTVIATKATLIGVSHVAKVVFYSTALSEITRSDALAIALAVPFSVLGSVAGHKILVRLTDDSFRAGTRWLVTGVGAFFFVQGVYLLTMTG